MLVKKTFIVKLDGFLTTMFLLKNGKYGIYTPTSRSHEKFTDELEIISKKQAKKYLKNKPC